jgi:hypothetical protein
MDSLLLVCTTWTQSDTNIAKGNYNLQTPNIYPRFLALYHILKKALQILCATNKYDSYSKEWCFLLKWMDTPQKKKRQTRM